MADLLSAEAEVSLPPRRRTRRPPKSAALPTRRRSLGARMRREWQSYVFIVPGLLFFLIFAYLPMAGNVIAFQDYTPFLGIQGSPWAGFSNFVAIVADPEMLNAVKNTLIIAFLQIVFSFPAPILLALLLNSLISERIKKAVQTVVYLPHFLSWVIVVAMWQEIMGGSGIFSRFMATIGVKGVDIMTDPNTFKLLVTSQVVWKDVGWGTIIFFAAITAIPVELYEAAAADGAGSWSRMWNVTLPGLVPIIALLLVLTVGNVLTVGFEQILLQQPSVGESSAEVIDTFVYFKGIAGGEWGISAAAGLVKGVISTILILAANRFAKRFGTDGAF